MLSILIHRILNCVLLFTNPVIHLNSLKDVDSEIRSRWDFQNKNNLENLWAIILSEDNRLLSCKILFEGSKTEVSLNPYVLSKHLCIYNGAKIIIAHNHPSNSLKPSQKDQIALDKIRVICSRFNYKLSDSLIMGTNKSYSMRYRVNI